MDVGSLKQFAAAGPQHMRRTVLVADLVESVRLMRVDERGAIERWRAFVRQVRDTVLPAHGGRLVKSLGDGLLLLFDRPTNAVATALALHALIAAEPGPAWHLRIGVHAADLVLDELDVYGSGVNLAARLAGSGRPGDTIVSAEVRDAVSDGLQLRVVDLGECHLKHWDETVRAFRIVALAAATGLATMPDTFLDERPGLAVIPLSTPPHTPAAWGDALAESMIVSLSANASMRVVSLLSTQALRHTPADPALVRQMLGATYLVTGSVSALDGRLHIELQLCDTRDRSVMWARRVDADQNGLFSGADGTVAELAQQLGMEIVRSEVRRARALPLANLDDYTLYLAGVHLLHRLARRDFERAHALLEHLAERHPRSAAPQAMLSKWHLLKVVQGWAEDRLQVGRQAQACARRAIDLDPEHALALSMEAIVVAQMEGDLHRARRLGEAALAIDPQESHTWLNLGGIHSYLGHTAEAVAMPQRAIELSPMDPARFVFDAFLAEGRLTARDFDGAAEAARASIRLNAMHQASHGILTIALTLAGRVEEARVAAGDLLRLNPAFRVGSYQRAYAGREQPHMVERLEALRAAGVPA